MNCSYGLTLLRTYSMEDEQSDRVKNKRHRVFKSQMDK